MEYEAKSEEAAEIRTQQQCILRGGVYLLHHLKDTFLPFLPPEYSIQARGVQS
jgi:hypothetical protein